MGLFDIFKSKPNTKTIQKRNYAGAKTTNSMFSWVTSNLTADAHIKQDLKTLRARSRDLMRNNDYAHKFKRLVKTNVIGPKGINLQSKVKDFNGNFDTVANSKIEEAWKLWCKLGNCDVTGKYSFIDIQKLAIGTVAEDGEVLVRKVMTKKGLKLQLVEADHLDENFNDESRNIFMGIEYDEWNKPIAYHLFKKHPGNIYYYGQTYSERERVSANEIIHLYLSDRISQSRGVPWVHAAITRLHQLGAYEEAELVAARLGAAKAGFFKQPEGEEYEGDDTDDQGNPIQEVEPGQFEVLPKGWEFTPYDPQHPTTAFKDFGKAILRGISSGLDVSYHSLANDLESVNYSSIRYGAIDERDVWRELQGWMCQHFMTPIFEDWLSDALLRQTIQLPFSKLEKFNSPMWQTRGWAWVDPLKDMTASVMAVKEGVKSMTQIISEDGNDIEEVYSDLAREKELRGKYGITTQGDAEIEKLAKEMIANEAKTAV